jgi:hypothetical protein
MRYQIEKNVPIPDRRSVSTSDLVLALSAMEIGDSFVVEDKATRSVTGSISVFRRKYPEKEFVTRSTGKSRALGVRVWRVK